jgi:uncharacterized integral membrane protein
MRIFIWLLRAFLFFALFAFALNNQEPATVRWFFGIDWRAPMVLLLLIAFVAGCAVGVFALLPSWWRYRRDAQRLGAPTPAPMPATAAAEPVSVLPSGFGPELPRREGL